MHLFLCARELSSVGGGGSQVACNDCSFKAEAAHATKETEPEQYSTNGDKDPSPSAEVYRKLVHNNTKVVRGVATRNAEKS